MSAASVQTLVLGLLALGTVGWGALVVRRWPPVAVVGFLAVLMLVPSWLAVPVVVDLAPTMVVGLGIVVSLFGRDVVRPAAFDILLLGFAAACAVMYMIGLISQNSLYWLVMWWVLPYLVARTIAARGQVQTVYDVVTVLVVVVAALAVVESVTNHNIFNAWFGMGNDWAELQYRGGRVRVEGAFGHSIALGAVLGMSIPMVWASRWRPWFRVVALVSIGIATLLTFSRIGMLTMMLALAASFVLLRTQMPVRVRWTILGVGAVIAVVLVPTVMRVFDDAGDEATGSADYRVLLLSLVPRLAVFGEATSPFVQLSSIDNELVLTGVRFGLLPLALLLLCAVVGVVLTLRRPNPGLVAAMVMLPGLTSVAFLTQFTAFFWFAVGIGVSALAADQAGTGQAGAARAGTARTDAARADT
ncbi:MAG: hypothetical protein LBU50_00315, partial [Cellulomonas sp.]|nr:hypothetical protein [Cellulomonas sp.]